MTDKNNTKPHPMNRYAPVFRIVHLLMMVAGTLLLLTGLKLLRFNWIDGESWRIDIIDLLSLSGAVLSEHIEIGSYLAALAAFYFTYLVLSRCFWRMFSDADSNRLQKTLFLALNVLLALTCITGVSLGYDYSLVFGYETVVVVHLVSVSFLILLSVFHVIRTLVLAGLGINDLFFDRLIGRKLKPLLLLISGIVALVVYTAPDYVSMQSRTLICRAQNRSVFVDGKLSDIEWMGVDQITVPLQHGANFDNGGTEVKVRALRDRRIVYFLFQWSDATRSLNKHLVKTKRGWVLIESEEDSRTGETIYSEDQLSVTFHRQPRGCVANCHLLPIPGMGRHYTDGDTTEFWSWRAVTSNPASQAIDGYWDSDLDARASGIHTENRAGGGFRLNLDQQWRQPYFLPSYFYVRDWINIMTESYEPYHDDFDTFAIGSKIPAIAVAPMMGDVADVHAFGRWRGSKWTLEMARYVSTGSLLDVNFIDTLYMSVAIFDNADKKHAYTMRPIRLIFE